MKKINILLSLAAAGALVCGCTGDLDTKPLNDTDNTAENAYSDPASYAQGLAKIYGGFVLVGANEGSADIDVSDAGYSELNRSFWTVQEYSTDEVKCAWVNDGTWVNEMNTMTWNASRNEGIYTTYVRIMQLVSYVNEYLRQTTDDKLDSRGVDDALKAKVHRYRAEARFLRAYGWWMGIDVFGKMPFIDEDSPVGTTSPPEIQREDLFDYVEGELLDLVSATSDLPAAKGNIYPQADQGCAWALLARMYLNAEVYTGTARWNDAKDAAAQVIASGYSLATDYAGIFMADNYTNSATKDELIFTIAYDATSVKSYGGTSFIVAASVSSADPVKASIGSDGWGGIRTTYEFAKEYFDVTNPDYTAGTFDSNDDRAMFYILDRQQEMTNIGSFEQGWSVIKWSNCDSGGVNRGSGPFSSTHMPLIRLSEMYLIYIEATIRAAGGSTSDATAVSYFNTIASRAIPTWTNVSTVSLNALFRERTRELYWEGHRRTDLIRFGYYTSNTFLWPWKGGSFAGVGVQSRYNLMPIPSEDLIANDNLSQNTGY